MLCKADRHALCGVALKKEQEHAAGENTEKEWSDVNKVDRKKLRTR